MNTLLKSICLSILIAFSLVSQVSAQYQSQANIVPEEQAKEATEGQVKRLNLSEKQEVDMYEVNLKYIKEVKQIRSEGRSISTMRKLKDMNRRMDKEVKAILDRDQIKEYFKLKEERRKEMKSR